MEIEVKNISGQLMNTTTIDPSIWNVEYNADLLHQAIYIYLANVRQWNSSTKSRSQVKYANQKIRNQKGSGRARVGSRRSPIMVGGGVAHGPHPKNIRKSLNKKMKQKALKVSLSDKYKNSDVYVINNSPLEESPSIKIMLSFISSLKFSGSILLVTGENDLILQKSCKNIKNIDILEASMLNAYNSSKPQNLVIFLSALEKIQSIWGDSTFKTTAKKTTAKKPATKKAPAKTTAVKKPAAKKAPAKKTAAKKAAVKKAE